jgi:hypothetical protein
VAGFTARGVGSNEKRSAEEEGAVAEGEEGSTMRDDDSGGGEGLEVVEEPKGEEVEGTGSAADSEGAHGIVDMVDGDVPWYQTLTNEETAPLNGQAHVFRFLFPGQVYDEHQALGDVKALVRILGTPVVSQALMTTACMHRMRPVFAHVEEKYHKHLSSVNLGWHLHDLNWPECAHGKMHIQAHLGDDAHVVFSCRMPPGGVRCTAQRRASPAEGWVPPVKKGRGPKEGSVAGHCLCTGKCATRTCPCKEGGVVCTDKCLRHSVPSCKCINKAVGAPQPPAPVPGVHLADGTLDHAQDSTTL